jgi:hypothetical protein
MLTIPSHLAPCRFFGSLYLVISKPDQIQDLINMNSSQHFGLFDWHVHVLIVLHDQYTLVY